MNIDYMTINDARNYLRVLASAVKKGLKFASYRYLVIGIQYSENI